MPKPTKPSWPSRPSNPVEVGLLLYPECQLAMAYGLTDLLQVAGSFSRRAGGRDLRVTHWQADDDARIARCFETRSGPPRGLDVVIAPGRLGGPLEPDDAAPYVRWLVRQAARGAVLTSACGGAFLVAQTGLLAGRPATTHWELVETFVTRFPDVRLEPGRILVDDGTIVTAGGLMAWTDLGMRLIERELGQEVMLETGRYFLIDVAGREQRHYSVLAPRLDHGDAPILRVQMWLRETQGRDARVAAMADRAAMEERTFLRRFKAATRMTPSEYAQRLRLDRARSMLQTTRRSVQQIAWDVGYGDPSAFNRVFGRVVGLSPGEYRRRFSVVPTAHAR